MKHLLSACLILGTSVGASAQLSIGNSQALTIGSGATFSYDGLVLQPSATFTTSAATTLVRNSAITKASIAPAIARAYTFSTPLTGFTGTMVMPYATGELGAIPEATLQFNVHDGTSWSTRTGVLNTTAKTVTVSGLASATIGEVSLAAAAAPLPLTLLSFGGVATPKGNDLSWKTAAERSLSHFELQRSADGNTFEVVASVQSGAANGQYHHLDVVSGAVYYRLRSIDKSGESSLSAVIRLNGEQIATGFSLVPNPASSSLRMDVATVGSNAQVSITDLAGRVVQQQTILSQSTMLQVAQLPAGMYLVRYQDDLQTTTMRLNKL